MKTQKLNVSYARFGFPLNLSFARIGNPQMKDFRQVLSQPRQYGTLSIRKHRDSSADSTLASLDSSQDTSNASYSHQSQNWEATSLSVQKPESQIKSASEAMLPISEGDDRLQEATEQRTQRDPLKRSMQAPRGPHFPGELGSILTSENSVPLVLASKVVGLHGPRRQPSFKHRFLNRVMSGLSNRTYSNLHSLEEPQTSTDISPETSVDSGTPRQSTSSSSIPDLEGGLEATLNAFPQPPKGLVVSPSTTTHNESEAEPSYRYRTLSIPFQAPALGIDLRLGVERDGCNPGESLSFTIETTAIYHSSLSDGSPLAESGALDVALVVDNS